MHSTYSQVSQNRTIMHTDPDQLLFHRFHTCQCSLLLLLVLRKSTLLVYLSGILQVVGRLLPVTIKITHPDSQKYIVVIIYTQQPIINIHSYTSTRTLFSHYQRVRCVTPLTAHVIPLLIVASLHSWFRTVISKMQWPHGLVLTVLSMYHHFKGKLKPNGT